MNSKKMFFIKLIIVFAMMLIGCEDKKNDEKITISGTVVGENAKLIDYVGIFQTGGDTDKVVDLQKDNADPRKLTTVVDFEWSIELPNAEDWDLFQVLGWQDSDNDSKFDPEYGEVYGWGYVGTDSFSIAGLWYFKSSSDSHNAGWNVDRFFQYEDLDNHLDDWFIKVD